MWLSDHPQCGAEPAGQLPPGSGAAAAALAELLEGTSWQSIVTSATGSTFIYVYRVYRPLHALEPSSAVQTVPTIRILSWQVCQNWCRVKLDFDSLGKKNNSQLGWANMYIIILLLFCKRLKRIKIFANLAWHQPSIAPGILRKN